MPAIPSPSQTGTSITRPPGSSTVTLIGVAATETLNADTLNITTGETVTGSLTLTTAASKIVPGATSLALRNNADNANNILISDAGAVTVRAGLTVTAGGETITAGDLTFGGTSQKIVAPTTSLLIRDHGDANTNITVLDAGGITTRSSITIGATGLRFTAGSGADGSVSTLQTGAGNGETINTASLGTARYKTNGAARTGVIMQAGTYDGQVVIVINEDTTAANTITFAAVGTSNVANGVTTVINGLTGKRFVWSASATTPAWYPC